MNHRSASRRYLKWSLIVLPLLIMISPIVSTWGSFSSTAPVTLGMDRVKNALSEFVFHFSMWFPRISYKYVLVPGLLELLFTFLLSSFLYREFVKIETEPLFDTSENRPERFRQLFLFGVILTIVVLLFVVWAFGSIYHEVGNAGPEKPKLPAKSERTMTFMLLVVLNPMIYQLVAGLCMTLFTRRFLGILIPMLTLGLLLYACLLTACFCLFDYGPFESLIFWSTAKERATRGYPPEVALWMTGTIGIGLLWLSLWPAGKLLVRRNQSKRNV